MAIDYTLHVGETIDQYNARIASARAAASGTTSQSGTTSSNAVNPITGKTNQQVLEESTAVAQKAAAMIGATFTPGYTPTSSDLSVGAQQAPTPTTIEQPTLSIQADVEAKKQALMSSLQAQQDRARQEAAAAQAKIDEFNAQQKAVLEEQKAALPEALQLGFEKAKQNELYVTQNFEENQKLVNELGDLLTEGNELIKQQRETTGLSAIRNPRINQTISDVNARVGVIEAVINARNGQIAQAYTMIDRVVNEAKVYRNDQLNYYTNLYNFYEGQKDTEGRKLIQLTADEKEYINAKINVLSNELAQADAVALKIKEAMADPATATIYANAGVTLNDTLESINTKLATYAYMKEVADTSNELSLNGYTQLVPGQAVPAGYESTVITDSKGNQKTWIKKIETKQEIVGSDTAGRSLVTFDTQGNVISQTQLTSGTGTPGIVGQISPTTQAIIDNPSLFDDLTPTKRQSVISELQINGYDTSNLGTKGLSDTAITNIAQSQKALSDLSDLRAIIEDNQDNIGPIVGLEALNPWSTKRQIQADINRVKQTVGKALEGGVLRKEDEEKYKQILATITDTPETALYKIDSLISSIQRDIENYKMLQGASGKSLDVKSPLTQNQTEINAEELRNKYNY